MKLRDLGRWFVLGAVSVLAGCGDSPSTPKATPVRGRVLYRGQPAAGVQVVFHPQFDIGPVKFLPGGTTDKDGVFKLSSARPDDGAPVGEYIVTFTWPFPSPNPKEGEPSVDRWENRYNNPSTSKWKVQIREGVNELEPLRID